MARVKRGLSAHAKHKKLLNQAKGYWMSRRKSVKKAHEAVLHAGQYAFAGRKDRKSQARRDWIMHINEALKAEGLQYSRFIHQLQVNKIELDRKILAQMVLEDPGTFKAVVEKIK